MQIREEEGENGPFPGVSGPALRKQGRQRKAAGREGGSRCGAGWPEGSKTGGSGFERPSVVTFPFGVLEGSEMNVVAALYL